MKYTKRAFKVRLRNYPTVRLRELARSKFTARNARIAVREMLKKRRR